MTRSTGTDEPSVQKEQKKASAGLLRYQKFSAAGIAFLALWYGALQSKDDNTTFMMNILITYAPIWLVLAVGGYLFIILVTGVLSFQDCPEAAKELDQDVAEAKVDLKKRGIL